MHGTLDRLVVESELLADNPLGDPSRRPLYVYLDVTDPEPPASDDPILNASHVLVVPHIGSATRAARERMTAVAVDNLLAGLAGEPLPHPAG